MLLLLKSLAGAGRLSSPAPQQHSTPDAVQMTMNHDLPNVTMRSVRVSDILLFHLLSFPSNGYTCYPSHLKSINRACFARLPLSTRNPQVPRPLPRSAVKISSTTSRNNANDNASTTSSIVPNAPSSLPTALGVEGDWSAYLDESRGLIYYFNPKTGESRCAYLCICSTMHRVNCIIVSPPFLNTSLFNIIQIRGSTRRRRFFKCIHEH